MVLFAYILSLLVRFICLNMEPTEIQKFYKNKTILITGATGFIGKTLIEKLIRSCSELKNIIVPIRAKKNEGIHDRINDFFNCKLWNELEKYMPLFKQKIIFIPSNLEEEKFGMISGDYDLVINTVNIIYHSAATVKFTAPLKEAVYCNVKITKNLINIAKEIKQLQAFVHVSTMWSHMIFDYTEENVKKSVYDPDFLINLVDNLDTHLIENIERNILITWPNTYVFTKYISENQIDVVKNKLPVAIVRIPGIPCTYKEPIPGWMNSIQSLTALGMGLATGLIKVGHYNPDAQINVVPADLTVNCLIAVAWDIFSQKNRNEVKVYNYNCRDDSINNRKFMDSFVFTKYPLEKAVWTPGYVIEPNKTLFKGYHILYETIPAFISDLFLGKNLLQKAVKKYSQINKILPAFCYYVKHEFNNVPELFNRLSANDQLLFNFDVKSIDWEQLMDIYTKGIKEFLNEDVINLEKAQAVRYLTPLYI